MQSYTSTRRVPTPEVTTPPPEQDTIASLRSLASLHDAGSLTDEEFALAKARLLNR
jgi:hypothetical protein